jgi:HAD superfamily hydrolase (TIGR01450 family)
MQHPIDAMLLDMDGVLYHGDRLLPGAADFLSRIRRIPHLFLTNNPILTPREVARKLARLGLPEPDPDRIITSAQATALWLTREISGFRYFAVGGDGLHQALRKAGTEDQDQADFVVVGEGPGLDYESLTLGLNLIVKQGARLVGTNPDLNVDATLNGSHRLLPGGGALLAPFMLASGVEPVVIGKPNPLLFEMALEQLDCTAERCLMIGDRPDTDIAGAAAMGMRTMLVRTGRFGPGEAWPEEIPAPDWDLEDLTQCAAALGI